jgi:tetratricopeptide (TPR) repeat protein
VNWLLAAIALAGQPTVDECSGVRPLSASLCRDALALEARGTPDEAATRWRSLVRNEPEFLYARLGLARALAASGKHTAAEEVLVTAPRGGDVIEALGMLYLDMERWTDAAVQFRALGNSAANPDATRLEALALAHFDPIEARDQFVIYLGFSQIDADAAIETALVVRDALEAMEEQEAAGAVLVALTDRVPEVGPRIEVLLDDYEMRVHAQRLASAAPTRLTGPQRGELDAVRTAFALGRYGEAAERATALAEIVPASPEVLGALADVLEQQGDIEGADRALRRAAALDPLEPAYPARLGDLLATWYAGRFDARGGPHGPAGAVENYDRALRLDPARADLWLRKAEVEIRLGRHEAAAVSLQRFLASAPPAGRNKAEAAVRSLDRERASIGELPPAPPSPVDVDPGVWLDYHLALAFSRRNRPADDVRVSDRARAQQILDRVRGQAPDLVEAINLTASLARLDGESEQAISLYEESLVRRPGQPRILTALGELVRAAQPDRSEQYWRSAAALGGPAAADAHYQLATLAWDRGQWWQTRSHLDAYFAGYTSDEHRARAEALRRQASSRTTLVYSGAALGVSAVVLLPLGFWAGRRRGVGLERLLEAAPAAYRDVARECSAIRHEVLKHNTTVLGPVADALERGEPDLARWAAERLFGPRGALDRFREHIAELESVGRQHGVRLNLRHRDPVFAPIVRAMDRLASLERPMRRGSTRCASDLHEISAALNDRGYRGLGQLIQRVVTLGVDRAFLEGVWRRVLAEPDMYAENSPSLELDFPSAPIQLRIYRGELEDVLTNVLRNSVRATLDAGLTRVGIRVVLEEDWVTGLERVGFRVVDDAPRRISTAMIRSRYLERGLGLTVDLISRNGGSIHVEEEPGWAKAVVIRLPVAEAPGREG